MATFYEVGSEGKEFSGGFAISGYAVAESSEDAVEKVSLMAGVRREVLVARVHMARGKVKSYTFKGRGLDTITDMLRYDDGEIISVEPQPKEIIDTYLIPPMTHKRYDGLQVLTVDVRLSRCTIGRWLSFGWHLV